MFSSSESCPASLAPIPPANRHRASSTNIRPALTIQTLGSRVRSSSLLGMPPPTPSPPSAKIKSNPLDIAADPPPGALALLVSRCIQLLHLHSKHASLMDSNPSSPRSSTDDPILPLSASPSQTTFGDVFSEKSSPLKSQVPSHSGWRIPSVHTPILFVVSLFPISTALVLFCFWTLPITGSWPRTLTDLAQMGRELHGYCLSGPGPMAHVLGVLSITAVWNHAWSIPGSVLWNVLAGALFSPALATLLLTALTTIGSIFASLLSAPLSPFLTRVFPRALDMTRSALEGSSAVSETSGKDSSRSPAWVRLSVLRLIGIVPWSGINIACGVTGVPLWDCVLGSFIGGLPWTAVTCQIGDILQTITSTPSLHQNQTISDLLTSPDMVVKLVFLSFLSAAPVLGRDYLRQWMADSVRSSQDLDGRRWQWVKGLGTKVSTKIRIHSRSQSRERIESERELNGLIDEKRKIELDAEA